MLTMFSCFRDFRIVISEQMQSTTLEEIFLLEIHLIATNSRTPSFEIVTTFLIYHRNIQ